MSTETERTHYVDPRVEDRAEWPRLPPVVPGAAEPTTTPSGGDVLDLTAPPTGRVVRLSTDAIRGLGLGELALVARTTGVPIGGLQAAMREPGGEAVVVAMAWALARRVEPLVTWEEAQAWRVEVVAPTGPDPTMTRPGP